MPPKHTDSRRDNFNAQVIRTLAERSGGRCAICRASTWGPSDSRFKSTNVGQAAHITAAAPGGPRYDHNITPQIRSSALNGMWLCGNCHHIIDKNVDDYPVDKLKGIKKKAEADAKAMLGVAIIKKAAPHDNSAITITTSANAIMEIRKVKTLLDDLIKGKSQKDPTDLLEQVKYIDIVCDAYLPEVGSELIQFYKLLVTFDSDRHTWLQVVRLLDEITTVYLSLLTQNDIDGICAIVDCMMVKKSNRLSTKDQRIQYESATVFLTKLAKQLEEKRKDLLNTAKYNLEQQSAKSKPKRKDKDEPDVGGISGNEVYKFQAVEGADEPSDWTFISTMCDLIESTDEECKVKEESLEEQGFITYVI